MRVALLLVLLGACGGGGGGGGGDDGGSLTPDAPAGFTVRDRARALANDLRGDGDFMIGIGNDNSGPYDHGIGIDLHYAYLNGYGDQGGWSTWVTGQNDGQYVTQFTDNASAHGVTPMFTYYQLALELENGNDAALSDTSRMHQYLADVRLMYGKLAATGKPAVVGFEPDFFGYLMQRATNGTPPDALPAVVDAPECGGLPQTAAGLTRCLVRIGRTVAPLVKIGFHASAWGAWFDDTDPNADVEGAAHQVADFLNSVGADETDFVGVETLDRDAGFWETSGGGPTCDVTGGSRGAVYWDEANQTLPDFAVHLRWVGALTDRLQRPAIWWQTPLGVPSDTCGGSDGAWRDDRVHYFFGHVADLANAGGAGMTFGTGAGGQTTLDTDGDQYKTAAAAYLAAPLAL